MLKRKSMPASVPIKQLKGKKNKYSKVKIKTWLFFIEKVSDMQQ